MKIGIDISQIVYQGSGVSVYIQNLVENLLKIDKENNYILFGSSLRLKSVLDNYHATVHGSYVSKVYRIPPIVLESLWNRLHIIPIETFIGKIDIFHTSDWLEPPSRCLKVTTIHDLVVYKYPETLHPRIVSNQRRKLEWVKKESKLIIAVSESTKQDIVEFLKIPAERIRVVYEACDAEFAETSRESIEKTKQKYGIVGQYVLVVGTREPRKNLKRVIEAHNLLLSQYPDIQLVIAGKYGWGEDIKNLKLLGYVPKEDLPALYTGAECFVYPSLYEGFGLPILEAMSCGCPVVTSNISSLPEVGGEAAVYVNPLEVDDLTRRIKEVLNFSSSSREKIIKKGFEQAKKFSWEKTALETLSLYQSILG